MTMRGARVLLMLSFAWSAQPARASPQEDARLGRAIELFNQFRDDEASEALREMLRHAPRASVAAKAHLYLGLIAFNTLDLDAAHRELQQAILLYPAIELPANSSPKARIEFGEIQRRLASRGQGGASVLVLPPSQTPDAFHAAPQAVSEESPGHPLPASFWWVGGSAVVASVAGTIFGSVSSSTLSTDKPVTAEGYTLHPISYGTWQAGQNEGLTADILWGVGGALLVSAVIVALTR